MGAVKTRVQRTPDGRWALIGVNGETICTFRSHRLAVAIGHKVGRVAQIEASWRLL